MKLTAIDVEQQKFRRVWRGYDPIDIQRFLEMVGQQIVEHNREVTELRQELKRSQRDIADMRSREESLKEAMMAAKRAMEECREQAQKEARLVLSEAELRGEKIIRDAQGKAQDLQEDVHDLHRQRVRFIEEMRGLLNTHARLLEVHETDGRMTEEEASVSVLQRLHAPSPPTYEDVHARQ